jgi:hypothetical protein
MRGGVDGNLHLTVPSINRRNATFSILPCWAFFRDSCFLYKYISAVIRTKKYQHHHTTGTIMKKTQKMTAADPNYITISTKITYCKYIAT